jgi:hypothetical protein
MTESLMGQKSNLDAAFRGGCEWYEAGRDFCSHLYVPKEPTDVSNLTFSPENVPVSVVCVMTLESQKNASWLYQSIADTIVQLFVPAIFGVIAYQEFASVSL